MGIAKWKDTRWRIYWPSEFPLQLPGQNTSNPFVGVPMVASKLSEFSLLSLEWANWHETM